MKREYILKLIMLLSLFAQSPILAQSTDPAAPKQPASNSTLNAGSKIARLPLAAASFVVGSVVGTPIAMARHSADEIDHAAKGMTQGMHHPWFIPFFSIVGPTALALGGLGGALEGPWYAIENSGANCIDKPFSKESFSLGEMEKWEAAD
jgi:hypothetical protein